MIMKSAGVIPALRELAEFFEKQHLKVTEQAEARHKAHLAQHSEIVAQDKRIGRQSVVIFVADCWPPV